MSILNAIREGEHEDLPLHLNDDSRNSFAELIA